MAYEQILYDVSEHIATVTLNRPDKLNAWTRKMYDEVRDAMLKAAQDDAVRVIILTGAGRGFCAGADMEDLSSIAGSSPNDTVATSRATHVTKADLPNRIDLPEVYSLRYTFFPTIPKPIIAAINGPAAGLGVVIPLYADIRFASASSVFTTAFARRGLIAEHGIDYMLAQIVGFPHAMDLLISARKIKSDEALRMGLVNQVFADESFMPQVRAYATELATQVSPRSMGVIKEQLYQTRSRTFGESIQFGYNQVYASLESEDFKEGVAHFVQRRAPHFTGR